MALSKPERYDALSRTWHDDLVEAMGRISRAGTAADKLWDALRGQRLTSEELLMRNVLDRVGDAAWWARDVLDLMENNNAE